MRPSFYGVSAVLAAVIAGCGSSAGHTASTHGTAAATTAAPTVGCQKVAAPTPKGAQHLSAPTLRLDPTRTYTVRMITSCGEIDIRLDVRHSPKTTASFAYLTRMGFYDSLTFHRIVPGFVIQGGDPLGNGRGGPGYTVVEAPPAGQTYTRGVVAMAKTQTDPRGASGSQFYIVSGPGAQQLPPDYALLGRVVTGDAVLSAIAATPNSGQPDNTPLSPVVIDKVTIQVSR
jgi:peptidyl-prolyl cis-trans isomerase B (cyclophilin B)